MTTSSKAEINAMLSRGVASQAPNDLPTKPEHFDDLVGRVGAGINTDLGLIGNFKQRAKLRKAASDVEDHKTQIGVRLAKQWLDGEAELIQKDWQRSFNERYSAIAVRSMASEYGVRIKLEGLLAASRRFVLVELKQELDALKGLLDNGTIDHDEFCEEGIAMRTRYHGMRNEFSAICDGYKQAATAPFSSR